MSLGLNRIGQIALAVGDVDASEAFYRDKLGLRDLYRFGDITFFDCCGVRLMLERAKEASEVGHPSPLYFACADIVLSVSELRKRNVAFTIEPHLIAKMEDHDLWMAFFADPDGNTLALMQEAPKGYVPAGEQGAAPGAAPALRSSDNMAHE
jgi:methylmalonyl-CoA/ethylmalonyl-CoA epimerase